MTDASTLAALDTLRRLRQSLSGVVSGLSPEAWQTIPEGFSNNVLWNVGHVVVTAEVLTYALSGLDTNVPREYVKMFRKGTSPADWDAPPDIDGVRRWLTESPDLLEADYRAGRFETYREYTTTPGVVLASVEDGIRFNLFHEGLHIGSVLALRKFVG